MNLKNSIIFIIIMLSSFPALIYPMERENEMEVDEIMPMCCDNDENYLPVEPEAIIASNLADLTVSIDQRIHESKNVIEAIKNINMLFFNVSNISSTFRDKFSQNISNNLRYAVAKIRKKFGGKEEYIKVLLYDLDALQNVKDYLKQNTKAAIAELINALRHNRLIAVGALTKAGIDNYIELKKSCRGFELSDDLVHALTYCLSSKTNQNALKLFIKNISNNRLRRTIFMEICSSEFCAPFSEHSSCIYERYKQKILSRILSQYPEAQVYFLDKYRCFRLDFVIDLWMLNSEKFKEFKRYMNELDIPIKVKYRNLNAINAKYKKYLEYRSIVKLTTD